MKEEETAIQTGVILCFRRYLAFWGGHRDTGQKQIKWLVRQKSRGEKKSKAVNAEKGSLPCFFLGLCRREPLRNDTWSYIYYCKRGMIFLGRNDGWQLKFVSREWRWTVTELFILGMEVRVSWGWVPEGTRHWQIYPAGRIWSPLFWILATH